MFEIVAKAFVYVLEGYAGLGFAFALLFICAGVQRVDSEAQGAGVGFRLLILPGVVAFWPMFACRWAHRIAQPPVESNPHRRLAQP
jgi:GNAT superfamily N-acetyltransferase